MSNAPGLIGTLFSEEEKRQARENFQLLFVSLMTDPICNLDCPDCYIGKKKLTGEELSLSERKSVLDQAVRLGAKTLRIAGAGEPFMDRDFWSLVDYAVSLEMSVFVFTNGTSIDEELARKIANYQKLTVVVKFSGFPDVMEKLTGCKGFYKTSNFIQHDGLQIPIYLKRLIDVRMNVPDQRGNSRLGVEFLLRKSNFDLCEPIFRWARRNNIVPYVEQNLEAGNALNWSDYNKERVSDQDAFQLSQTLSHIDSKEFGYDWKPSIPYMVGGICETEMTGCKKYTYNIVIDSDGKAIPCYAAKFNLDSVREKSLQEILQHPIRKELLESNFNCLCRVYSKTEGIKDNPKDLDKTKDYMFPPIG